MTPGMKIAAAVVGGYVLGRRKKAKLAVTMGAWLVGKKLNLDPKKLLSDVTRELASSPELAGVRDQVRDEVLGAGKTLAADILTHQAGRLAGSLQERTDSLRDKAAGLPAAVTGRDGADDREPEEADDAEDSGAEENDTPPRARKKPRSAPQRERKPARKTSGSSSSSTTRKRASSGGRAQKRSSGAAGVNRG
ncbi:hypothetical protein [Amycolatopsis orientalis]|uniref:hypothetical protein n=1 Tax=Amycolatopsis orientalis TaxID=31958 RepID=UPI0003A74301|nr:hypothetical protein [Amycolatopsis orientalis]